MGVPDRGTFEQAYAGQAPWDIGRAQRAFVEVAEQVAGPVLDAGCGTGDNALFFAERELAVTGIDFVEEAIRRAAQKAAERGLDVNFLVKDALTLADWNERFASCLDSGLFHVFDDAARARYVGGLARVLRPGGCSYSVLATQSRGRWDRGGCRRWDCGRPFARAGRSSRSKRGGSKCGRT